MSTGLLSPGAQRREAEVIELDETAPPSRRLFTQPQQFDFFQAVRLLESLAPGRRAVGSNASPDEEFVRFKAALGAAFPASSVADLADSDEEHAPPEMTIAFLGLTGPSGALPAHYTDLLWRLNRDVRTPEKHALREWFDLFNHRLASLFYKAWEKYRPFVAYQRGEHQETTPDTFTRGMMGFAGLGVQALACQPLEDRLKPGLQRSYQFPRALLRYAGLLAQRPRNVANLAAILNDYFALQIEIVQFVGEWVALACEQQSQLGSLGTLGCDAIVGPRAWNRQGKVRLRVGPLSLAQFQQLLPHCEAADGSTPHLGEIATLARIYLGPSLDFDIQLVLRGDELAAARVGAQSTSRLGWNAWLPDGASADRDDAVFA
jgi:type VI secretion system protein ImpH